MEKVQNSIIVTFPLQFESNKILFSVFFFFWTPPFLYFFSISQHVCKFSQTHLQLISVALHLSGLPTPSSTPSKWKVVAVMMVDAITVKILICGWLKHWTVRWLAGSVLQVSRSTFFFSGKIWSSEETTRNKITITWLRKMETGMIVYHWAQCLKDDLEDQAKKFVFGCMSGLCERADGEEWLDVRAGK